MEKPYRAPTAASKEKESPSFLKPSSSSKAVSRLSPHSVVRAWSARCERSADHRRKWSLYEWAQHIFLAEFSTKGLWNYRAVWQTMLCSPGSLHHACCIQGLVPLPSRSKNSLNSLNFGGGGWSIPPNFLEGLDEGSFPPPIPICSSPLKVIIVL